MRVGKVGLVAGISVVRDLQPVTSIALRGATRPTMQVDGDGRLWVAKRLAHERIRGEVVGFLLGRELGVPVPEIALGPPGSGLCLSHYKEAPEHWSIEVLPAVSNYEGLGRMLALDAIIGNQDRNARNILFQPLEDAHYSSAAYELWCIDHEDVLANKPASLEGLEDRAPTPGSLPIDFPIDRSIEASASDAAQAAVRVADGAIRAIAADACRPSQGSGSSELADALRVRCGNAAVILVKYFHALRGRR